MYKLLIIMWATGMTPKDWKVSNTILLYKNKGDLLLKGTDVSLYGPITLLNALYKLWTRMKAKALNEYADHEIKEKATPHHRGVC